MRSVLLWLVAGVICLLGVGALSGRAEADVEQIVMWTPGPGSEEYFSRRREGAPSSCIIRQGILPESGELANRRSTLQIELDCRSKPTGGRVLFESFKTRSLVAGWTLSLVRIRDNAGSGTRVERLQVPTVGGENLESRIRLVAQRGRRVFVTMELHAKLPESRVMPRGPVSPTDAVWCDKGGALGGGFSCAYDNQCQPGFFCSSNCGNICVRRY